MVVRGAVGRGKPMLLSGCQEFVLAAVGSADADVGMFVTRILLVGAPLVEQPLAVR